MATSTPTDTDAVLAEREAAANELLRAFAALVALLATRLDHPSEENIDRTVHDVAGMVTALVASYAVQRGVIERGLADPGSMWAYVRANVMDFSEEAVDQLMTEVAARVGPGPHESEALKYILDA